MVCEFQGGKKFEMYIIACGGLVILGYALVTTRAHRAEQLLTVKKWLPW